jgi:hypothetical protein
MLRVPSEHPRIFAEQRDATDKNQNYNTAYAHRFDPHGKLIPRWLDTAGQIM